jgi:PKD repeat protein
MAHSPRMLLVKALLLALFVSVSASVMVYGADSAALGSQQSVAEQPPPTPTLVAPTPAPLLKALPQDAAPTPGSYRLPAPVWTLPQSTEPQPTVKLNLAPMAPAATAGVVALLNEGFEGAFPDAAWTLFDTSNDGFEHLWNDVTPFAFSGAWSGWPGAGGANALDPATSPYASNMDSWMIYGPLDLQDAAAADVSFQLLRATEPIYDSLSVLVSLDGTLFNEQARWDNVAGWEWIHLNLNGYSGQPAVWVAWRFQSDGSITNTGPFVDDIAVTKTVDDCVDIGGLFSCPLAATLGWLITPLGLAQGQAFTILPTAGTWSVDALNLPWSGPEGYPIDIDSTIPDGCKYDPSQPYAALLGQVGGGALFPVGLGGTFVADADGALALRINDHDGCLGDNGGTLLFRLLTTTDFTLQTNPSGGGIIEVTPAQASYSYGDLLNLTAIPDPGWTFLEWSGDLDGAATNAFLTMDGYKTVNAYFIDQAPPATDWVSPVSNDGDVHHTLCGESTTLEVTASDNSGISHVLFQRWDAVNLTWVELAFVPTSPYLATIDTCTLNQGLNQVDAVAVDFWGNSTTRYFWLSRDDGAITADFAATPLTGNAPLSVSFQNLATGAYTDCLWDYGDGTTGTACDAFHDHVYNAPGSYTVSLTVSGPGGSATQSYAAYIVVSEPTVQLSVASLTVNEGDGTATLDVLLSAASSTAVTVHYTASDGTARAGSDYTATSGTLTFAPNETSQPILIPISNDAADEENETVTLTLSNPSNATLGSPASTGLTIVDDDAPPEVRFSAATGASAENSGTATLVVTLSAASGKSITVNYATSNGTATAGSDYTATSGTLTFAPNETSKSFPVTILDDTTDEPDETITLALTTPTNAALGTPGTATLTITDNDPTTPPPPTVTAQFSATPTTGNPPLTVTFTDASIGTITGWSWNFGDGQTSTAQNPSHVYQQTGSYTVTLTVNGPNGSDSEQKAGLIEVAPTLQPDEPALSIPDQLPAVAGNRITIPIAFEAKGSQISSLLFSIDFDERVLTLDLTDANGDEVPDAIQFSAALPANVIKTVDSEGVNTDGRLDFTIADFSASPRAFADGVLVTLTLGVAPTAPAGTEASISLPLTSFGGTGNDTPGNPLAGSILVVIPQLEVTATPARIPADGTSTSQITAVVRDSQNHPLANQRITFGTTHGRITTSATTNAAGQATATLTSATTPGSATVTATIGEVQEAVTVTFVKEDSALFLPLIRR